jgi:hypothetical protein
MKKLALPLILLCLPAFIIAQKKKDNCIVIHGVAFKDVLIHFLDMNYTFTMKDDSLMIFSTSQREDKHHNLVIFHGRIMADSLILTGELNPNMTLHLGGVSSAMTFMPIMCKGTSDSPMRQSWDFMNSLALSFNKPVNYKRIE